MRSFLFKRTNGETSSRIQRRGCSNSRQNNRKATARPRSAGHFDTSAKCIHQRFHNKKTEPSSFSIGIFFCSFVALKQERNVFLGNAWTCVTHFNFHALTHNNSTQVHLPPFGSELECVVQQ